jgi:conjugal transfer/type IV secretion protein DotA/TraY
MGALFPSSFSFMGTSLGIPDLGKYASIGALIVLGIYALLLPVFAMMWAFGAMLAVYCPLIPFLIFTMAALGWMLTVVEAIIAAPIVALGIILPSGDDIGKIEPALNILANIFLRPMLMIFGFLLAGRVFKAVVLLINFGIGSVFGSIDVSTMFSTLAVIAVYTTFIISVTNTCFSLIYAVPDKILRWIGGHGESTNVDAVSSAKEATQKAGSEIGGGMSGAGGLAANKGAGFAMKDANKSAAFKAIADRMGINKKDDGA